MDSEFLAQVLSSTVRVKDLDSGVILSTKVGLKFLVHREGVVFLVEEVNMCIVCFVINNADIVPSPLQGCNALQQFQYFGWL